MTRSDMKKNKSKTKIILAALIVGMAVIAGIVYWHSGNDGDTGAAVDATQPVALNMSEQDIVDAEKNASIAAVSGETVTGTVTERPDYITEIEWQVLQSVTRQNPDIKLNDLVNKMLFAKKKQAWLSAEKDSAERKLLAKQLLDMIPGQVAMEAIDGATAQTMEAELHADLLR